MIHLHHLNFLILIPCLLLSNPCKKKLIIMEHFINVLNPERHGGDGLNNSYISYEITSKFVK
jgi:hypothetical protein